MTVDAAGALERYGDTVYRTAYACLLNRQAAEDAASDVFLKLYDRRDSLEIKDEEHLKAWLIRVTVNRCRDILRSDKKRGGELGEDIPSPDSTVRSDEREDVRRALGTLKEKYRAVIYLYYYEEYKTEEIAGLLGVSKGTVVSRLKRARDKLRPLLSDYGRER